MKAENGREFVPVTNVGTIDVWLTPRRVLADIVIKVREQVQVCVDSEGCTAFMLSQEITSSNIELDLPEFKNLGEREGEQARALLTKYSTVLAKK